MPGRRRDRRSGLERMLEELNKQPIPKGGGASKETIDDIFSATRKHSAELEVGQGSDNPPEPGDSISVQNDALPLLPTVSNKDRELIANDPKLARLLSDGSLSGVRGKVRARIRIITGLDLLEILDWDQYHADHPDKYPAK